MLIAARDEDGTACVFNGDKIKWRGGAWSAEFPGSAKCLFVRVDAEPFCRNIPPGEKRVIDLAASTIVHVAPPKTAVEELVEKAEAIANELCDGGQSDSCIKRSFRDWKKCVDGLRKALARVKEAANAK